MLRFLIAGLLLILYLLISIPFLGVEWIVGLINRRAADISQLRFVQAGFRIVLWIAGTRVTYIGNENLPKKGEAVLYTANHRGIFDIVAAYAHMPDLTGFISKDSIAKVPVLRLLMKRLHCLFLNRKNNKQGMQTILKSIEYMEKGISIFIFPEGTRNRNDDPTQLRMMHNGSFKAAQRLGCPVVPVAITGSDLILEKHFPKIRAGRITVRFGKPVYYKDIPEEKRKNVGDYFAEIITEMLKENALLE